MTSYQEVGGGRHGDPVVEQFPGVVVHGTALLHRLAAKQELQSENKYISDKTAISVNNSLMTKLAGDYFNNQLIGKDVYL